MRMLLLVATLALVGCVHAPKSNSVCPEYRDLHCVGVECSLDKTRGCDACRCGVSRLGSPNDEVRAALPSKPREGGQ